jgi:hypothetical protein
MEAAVVDAGSTIGGASSVRLMRDELEMLEGKHGAAKRKAMELLVRYADGLGAERFIDTNNVTLIAGTLPDIKILKKAVPSLDMDAIASKFYLGSDEVVVVDRVAAFTSSNATHRDQHYPDLQKGGAEACALMREIEAYLRRIGVVNLLTCTPYQAGNIPSRGEHCAWIESSAQAYCNSVLGACTNIEGMHSAFASAITGKTPLWGMHLPENRYANVEVFVECQPITTQDWYMMGYHFGALLGQDIPIFTNIEKKPNRYRLIAFSAAGMTSGSVVMYHILGVTPEAPTMEIATGGRKITNKLHYGAKDRASTYERLNRSDRDQVDIIILGCPHYGLDEMKKVATLLEGKRVNASTALYITTLRSVKAIMDREGYSDVITNAGAIILEDSCGLVLNVADPSMVMATDSAKMAQYFPGVTGAQRVWFGTTEECISAAVSGRWRGRLQ